MVYYLYTISYNWINLIQKHAEVQMEISDEDILRLYILVCLVISVYCAFVNNEAGNHSSSDDTSSPRAMRAFRSFS